MNHFSQQLNMSHISQCKPLVQVPATIWSRAQSPERASIAQPALQRPAADALIGHVYAAFGEHIFNIAIAEGKPEIQPDGVLDD